MEVNKYLLKKIINNKVQLVAITILIASVAILFNCLYLGVVYVQKNYTYMIEHSDRSSISFLPEINLTEQQVVQIFEEYDIPVSQEKIEVRSLVDSYDIDLEPYYQQRMEELHEKYDFEDTKFFYKVIEEHNKIYFLTSYKGNINHIIGQKSLENNSVALTTQNNFPQKIILDKKSHAVQGSFSSVDFIQLYDMEYSNSNLTTNNIGVWMTDYDYNNVQASEKMYYLLQFKSTQEEKKFEKEQLPLSKYYLDTKDYLKNFEETIEMNFRLALIPLIIYSIITLIILYITFRNLLDSMDRDFGLLKIIGIKKSRIVLCMSLIYTFLAVVGLIIGHLIGRSSLMLMRNQFIPLYNFVYSIDVSFFKYYILFYGIFLLSVILLISLLVVAKVKKRTLVLLKSESLSRNSFFLRLSKKYTTRIPFFLALKTSFALKKISRLFIIILGVFLTTSFLSLGIGLFSEQLSQVQGLNDSVNYEKIYFYKQEVQSNNKNTAYLTEGKLKKNGTIQTISLIGLRSTGDVYQKDIYSHLQDNSIVVSKNIAKRNNLKKGDQVIVSVLGVDITLNVAYIMNNNYENRNFISLETLYPNVITENQFNLFYQKKNTTMTPAELSKAMRIEKFEVFKENNMNNFSQILMIVAVLLVFSVLIVILVFALIASLSIYDNIQDMEIMGLLGYRPFAIFRATTVTYLLSIIIVLFFGALVFPAICQVFEQLLNVGNWQFYIGIDSHMYIYLISSVIVILNYYFWMCIIFIKNVSKKNISIK